MVKKCSVYGCDTNYAFIKKEKMKTLRREILERLVKITKIKFPKDENEREKWVNIIRKIKILRWLTEQLCVKSNGPSISKKIEAFGKYRPKNPPETPYRKARGTQQASRDEKNQKSIQYFQEQIGTWSDMLKRKRQHLKVYTTTYKTKRLKGLLFKRNSVLDIQLPQYVPGTQKF